MTAEADGNEYHYRLGNISPEIIRRPTKWGDFVEIPRWFEVKLTHPGIDGEIVLFVTVDMDRGPILTGYRPAMGSTVGHADALNALKATFPLTGGDMDGILQFSTAMAAGAYATGKALDPHLAQIELTDQTLKAIGELRDTFAHRAFTAVRPQRRVVVTHDFLREVAEVYRAAYAAGNPPTVAVSQHYVVSHRTATRWVAKARELGLLGPARGTTAGEAVPDEGDDS